MAQPKRSPSGLFSHQPSPGQGNSLKPVSHACSRCGAPLLFLFALQDPPSPRHFPPRYRTANPTKVDLPLSFFCCKATAPAWVTPKDSRRGDGQPPPLPLTVTSCSCSPPLYQAANSPPVPVTSTISPNPFSASTVPAQRQWQAGPRQHGVHQPDLSTLGTQMKTGLGDKPASQVCFLKLNANEDGGHFAKINTASRCGVSALL